VDLTIVCLVIFALTIISFIINKFTLATTALLGMLAMVLTGCLDLETALNTFANPNVILIASMLVVASGLNRTQFVNKFADLTCRISGGSLTKALTGYLLIAAILLQFVPSVTACFAIVYPLLIKTSEKMGVSPSKVIFPLGVVCCATGAILPVASGATLFAQLNGFLQVFQYTDYAFKITDSFFARMPILVVVLLYTVFIAPKFAPNQPQLDLASSGQQNKKEEPPLGPVREVLGYSIFFAVFLAMILQPFIGIEYWVIAFTGAILMVATGVLSEARAIGSMGLSVVLLFVGALGISSALQATGAGELLGKFIASMLGNTTNGFLIGFVFFIVPFILTQLMSNVAVMMIFLPVSIVTCQALGCSPIGPCLQVIIGAMTGFITPMASPVAAMMPGLGGYTMKSMLKQGLLASLPIVIIASFWTMTIFPAFPK